MIITYQRVPVGLKERSEKFENRPPRLLALMVLKIIIRKWNKMPSILVLP